MAFCNVYVSSHYTPSMAFHAVLDKRHDSAFKKIQGVQNEAVSLGNVSCKQVVRAMTVMVAS
jgi:hypothetical protein